MTSPIVPPRSAPAETRAPRGSDLDASLDPGRLRWVVLPILMAMATFLRFLSLPDRGIFDSDQGRDFLVLRSMLVDGVVPLLGPPASVGGIHHGVAYYYLLAPLAWLSHLDPTVVAMLFAAAGVGAVYLVWWLAKTIAGPTAGLVAGMLYALSPTAIAASITNWNPNLIGLTASLALAAAWKAWITRDGRWWVLALVAATLTVQLHVISVLMVLPLAGLLVADVRRSAVGTIRRSLLRWVVAGLALSALLFVPLLASELSTGFAEVRGALAFLASDRGPASLDPASRLLIVVLRITSYPVVGLIIDAPTAAILLTMLVIAFCAWRWHAAGGDERIAVRLIVAVLGVSAVGLTLLVPDLGVVIRGLPNDHYHAFTDPLIAVMLGLGVAAIVGPRRSGSQRQWLTFRAERILVGAGIIVMLVFELIRLPPPADPNGGWPAALAGAERISRVTSAQTFMVVGLPVFKPTGAVLFPLLQLGREVVNGHEASEGTQAAPLKAASVPPGALVVVCDRLFEPVLEAPCGGEAESRLSHPDFPVLLDRFDISQRTSISVYGPTGATGL